MSRFKFRQPLKQLGLFDQQPEPDRRHLPKFCQGNPMPVPPDPTDADIDHWLREIAREDAIESGIRERPVDHAD